MAAVTHFDHCSKLIALAERPYKLGKIIERIRKLLTHKAQMQRKQCQLARQLPLPSKAVILGRLAKET